MNRVQLRVMLARMESRLAETRRNLSQAERVLGNRAEAETIRRRPKARYFHRRMSRWTGADEAEYRRVLADLLEVSGPDLDRLQRKIDRQNAAIEALRRKYGVNTERPWFSDW
jgi:hypothetical protein